MIVGTRLAFFDILRALGAWRWLSVPPIFFVAGWLGADIAEYDFTTQDYRDANLWDGPLTMMTDNSAIVFAFVFGFVIVTGDLYVRDRSSGAAAMTLLRSRSRTVWWMAKVCAFGPLALVFSVLAFLSSLVASAIQLPVSLHWSSASMIPWKDQSALYPGSGAMPPAIFLLMVALYTAAVLWSVGAVVLGISALYPRPLTPLVIGLVWSLAGTPLVAPLYFREGAGTLDPVYHLSYVIHFGNERGFEAMPWIVSVAVVSMTLGLVLVLGSWRLRWADV